MSKQLVTKDNNLLIFQCPSCLLYIQDNENDVNCRIFRHGVLKDNKLTQIDPHSSEICCSQLVKSNKIYGCGKPFSLKNEQDGSLYVEQCDYI